jgi:spermidine dehydrogenase
MTWNDFETAIVGQLRGALARGGFDAARDIAAITVNRWPHGYAYEYNEYSDPPEYGRDRGPHVTGRAPIGRISIANSDASAYAYVDGPSTPPGVRSTNRRRLPESRAADG